jgi:hypothetical protein
MNMENTVIMQAAQVEELQGKVNRLSAENTALRKTIEEMQMKLRQIIDISAKAVS